MQFSSLLIASAAFALAQSKVILTNVVYANITAGEPFTITWANATGPVALVLRGAQPGAPTTDPANLFAVYTIDSNLQGNSYVWSVPENTPQSTYAIEIRDAQDTNYGALWEVRNGVAATTLATGSFTGTVTRSASQTTGSAATESLTGTDSTETGTATGTNTRSSATTTASRTAASTSASATATAAPAGGMASGLTSNLALVFGAAAALFMLN